ncbi:multicopper oxidase family protein [Nakamurella sp.]|uniref:multicopper oxidase family protein n=1 Tax=Nakamurella sp. TaxID=1869182 RepID=UPI003B3BBBC0
MTEQWSRRRVLKLGAALGGVPLLMACSPTPAGPAGSGSTAAGPAGGAAASGSATSGSGTSAAAGSVRPTALHRSENGVLQTTLTPRPAQVDIGAARPITTWAYDGLLPGPTWDIAPGDVLRVELVNDLPAEPPGTGTSASASPAPSSASGSAGHDGHDMAADPMPMDRPHQWTTTNLHYHGMHVSPEGNGDDVFLTVQPGERYQYEIEVPADHPGGLYWYHPHRHGGVAQQIRGGMAGAIIIRGAIDTVPEVAAAAEQLMVIQAIEVDDTFTVPQPIPDPSATEAFFPRNQILYPINGGLSPTLSMRPGEVARWRILNAAEGKFINLVADGLEFHVIAWDGLTLPEPDRVPNLFLSAGNRVEVLVRATTAGTVTLQCTPSSSQKPGTQGVPGSTEGLPPELVTRPIATIEVAGDPVTMALPAELPAFDQEIGPIVRTREVTYSVERNGTQFEDFGVDGQQFTAALPPYQVKLGTAEEWTVVNGVDEKLPQHAHVFHIHVNPFKITRINGQVLDKPLWRDTYILTGNTGDSFTFQTNFLDFTGKFVDHCHIVSHEDLGMMETIEVVP